VHCVEANLIPDNAFVSFCGALCVRGVGGDGPRTFRWHWYVWWGVQHRSSMLKVLVFHHVAVAAHLQILKPAEKKQKVLYSSASTAKPGSTPGKPKSAMR
jgi:hypothetical protein